MSHHQLHEKLQGAQRDLLMGVSDFREFIKIYKTAESAYRSAHGRAMLQATGTEKLKKAAADIVASAEMAARNEAEALYEWHKENIRSLRQYLSSVQSEAAGNREEDKATNYGAGDPF